jgi:hypothetical protein
MRPNLIRGTTLILKKTKMKMRKEIMTMKMQMRKTMAMAQVLRRVNDARWAVTIGVQGNAKNSMTQ